MTTLLQLLPETTEGIEDQLQMDKTMDGWMEVKMDGWTTD